MRDESVPILSSFKAAANRQDQPKIQSKPKQTQSRKTPPFSLRFTEEERAYLDKKAGYRPLARYIRDQILGDFTAKRRGELRQPSINRKQYVALLSALGESRLSSNLNQLAKHANTGSLDASPEVEAKLVAACEAVMVMRDSLLHALGQRPTNRQESDQ